MRRFFLQTPLVLLLATSAFANEALFITKTCNTCHDPLKDQIKRGLGPSIAQIKEKYGTDTAALVLFLKKEGEPRVYPHRFELMKQQLDSIALTDAERKALAEYLLK